MESMLNIKYNSMYAKHIHNSMYAKQAHRLS